MGIGDEMKANLYALAQDLGKSYKGKVTKVYTIDTTKELITGETVPYRALIVEGVVTSNGSNSGKRFKWSYRPLHFAEILEPELNKLGIEPEDMEGKEFQWKLKECSFAGAYPRFAPTKLLN